MRTLPLLGAATLLLAACSTGGTGGTGSPSASGSGGLSSLINVNLSNIRAEIAKNVDLNLEDVPITIQLPITVAANVCGVDVNLLSVNAASGGNTCTAVTSSPTLEQTVKNQV